MIKLKQPSNPCTNCPLDKAQLHHPKMLPTGSPTPIWYILGEAPGEVEDKHGEQFIGKSGTLIRDRIKSRWLKSIRWNNTIRCRPPGNRDPSAKELACCRSLQVRDIEQSKPWAVLAVGRLALQWFLGDTFSEKELKISDWSGKRFIATIGKHTCWVYVVTHPAAILYIQHEAKKGPAYLRTFQVHLQRAFLDYEREATPKDSIDYEREPKPAVAQLPELGRGRYLFVFEKSKIIGALQELKSNKDISIDLETNSLRPYSINRKLLTIAVSTAERTIAFPFEHPERPLDADAQAAVGACLCRLLAHKARKVWAHKVQFEIEWLLPYLNEQTLTTAINWQCTLAQAYVIDSRPGNSLGALTQRYLGFNVKAYSRLDVHNLEYAPLQDVLMYNALDAQVIEPLAGIQGQYIRREKLEAIYSLIKDTSVSFALMQAKGIERDIETVDLLSQQYKDKKAAIVKQIATDPDVQRHCKPNFNPLSPAQLAVFLFDKLGIRTQARSTSEGLLKTIKHPVAKLVLKLRTLAKLRSTYLTPFAAGGAQVFDDGKIRTEYSATTTATSRGSSSNPNLQNFPARNHPEIRSIIRAPKDCWLVKCDYGQLEARCIAMASKDKTLVAECVANQDIHQDWTLVLAGEFHPKIISNEKALKEYRNAVKNSWTFPIFYGASVGAVASYLEVDEHRLAPFYNQFLDKYGGVKQWQEAVCSFYQAHNYCETLLGFRRYGPLSRNEIINTPIQGTGAHLTFEAQNKLSMMAAQADEPWLRPVMNVHDDLTFYLPDDKMDDAVGLIARIMCCSTFPWVNVPLCVELSAGKAWHPVEQIAKFYTTDFIQTEFT